MKFHEHKIMSAIERAGLETGELLRQRRQNWLKSHDAFAKEVAEKVPTVEQIQDAVEEVLLDSRYKKRPKLTSFTAISTKNP